ncbi:MAG: tetratricopeptide repeat protein [Candidatus Melainabacteria bacterium]|nr:tetratricopeptide repeat protein [Candidatus Melainabacteria bacterium]
MMTPLLSGILHSLQKHRLSNRKGSPSRLLASGRLAFVLLGLFASLSWAALPSDGGVAAYKAARYDRAVQLLTPVLKSNPKDSTAWFYLGLSLSKTGQYGDAKMAFEQVTRLLPSNHELAAKARSNLSVLTRAQLQQNGSAAKAQQVKVAQQQAGNAHYLGAAIHNGQVVHWEKARMPLKVYIVPGNNVPGWKADYRAMVFQAMQAWQGATYNQVRFQETRNPAQADITVRWIQQMAHNRIGENPFEARGNSIVRSDVTVSLFNGASGRVLSDNQVLQTITHELGHAIGIQGHSPFPEDLMYYASNPAQVGTLTQRDKATIRLLYKMEADISNKTALSTQQTRTFYDWMSEGVEHHQAGRLTEALKFYQQAQSLQPNDPGLLQNLGAVYAAQGQWNLAENAYRKSLHVKPNQSNVQHDLGRVLNQLGVQAARKNDVQSAKVRFQEAIRLLEAAGQAQTSIQGLAENLAAARKNLSLLANN